MKKVIMAFLAVSMLAGGAARQALAQGKRTQLSLNIGLNYDNESEEMFMWTIDARAGFRLGERVQLSPEVMCAGAYNELVISPGVILNYVARRAFFGGGLVVQFRHDWWDDYFDAAAKFNIGFAWTHLILTAYYIGRFYTDEETDLFGYHQIGFTFGYRF